jgi:hypothetical protein
MSELTTEAIMFFDSSQGYPDNTDQHHHDKQKPTDTKPND